MTETDKLLVRIGTARDAISRKTEHTSLDYMIDGVLMNCYVLLKEQEARIIDWDELKDWGNAVWLEVKDEQACYIVLTAYVGTYYATFINVEPGKFHKFDVLYILYKKKCRCWSAKPTIKQRQEAKWK